MKILEVLLTQQTLPTEDPAVNCDLANKTKDALGNIVGNIIGLQSLVPWILAVLVTVVIIVAVIPKLRAAVLQNLLWVIGIAVFATVAVGLVALFTNNPCT